MQPISLHNYTELLDAIRARRDELNLPHSVIDDLVGLQDGYTSKVLAPHPTRGIGSISWHILEALGLGLVLIDLPDALARTKRSHRYRQRKFARPVTGSR